MRENKCNRFPRQSERTLGLRSMMSRKALSHQKRSPFTASPVGVLEIVTRFETHTYRTVYAVQIGKRVYVLHAFQKKAPKGRQTAKLDVDMIVRRYKEAVKMEKEKK